MKKIALIISVMVPLIMASNSARAENEFLPNDYVACKNKAVSTMDIGQCFEAASKKLDAALNKNYKVLGGSENTKLRDTQRAWLKWRELDCRYSSDMDGTIAGIVYGECMLNITGARVAELADLAKGEGN